MNNWAKEKRINSRKSQQPTLFALSVVLLAVLGTGIALWVLQSPFEAARHTIAFIPQTTGTELWESAHVGAQAEGREAGFRIYWNAPTRDDDVERQIELIEGAIRRQDAGLIVAPTQYLALISPLQEALGKHIPVVVVSSSLPLPPGNGLVYLLSDDAAAGKIAARRLGTLLHGSGKIAMVGVNPSMTALLVRAQAFRQTLASEFPGISIIESSATSSPSAEAAESAVGDLLRRPDLDAVFGLSSTATEGALNALRMLHRTRSIRIVGCDQELDLMAGIRQGEIDAIVVQNSFSIGYQAVSEITAQLSGRAVPPQVLVPPVLVTRDNIDDPEVQKMLSVNWRPGQ